MLLYGGEGLFQVGDDVSTCSVPMERRTVFRRTPAAPFSFPETAYMDRPRLSNIPSVCLAIDSAYSSNVSFLRQDIDMLCRYAILMK